MRAPIQSAAWSFSQPHVSMFTCVLSHYTVALTITHTRPTKQAGHIPLGKNCSVLDNLAPSSGSRKIVVWGIWCGGVRDCLHVQQCGLHGMRKMWSEEDVTMLTLSNGIVTPSVCLSYQRQRNEAVTYTQKKKAKERKCFQTRWWEAAGEFYFSMQCWSAKRRKYVFTSVMGTEFFTLCLIRKREKRERGVKNWGM